MSNGPMMSSLRSWTSGVCAFVLSFAVGALQAESLRPFGAGEVVVGGEIGRRLSVTVEKMLHHTDIERTFAGHFKDRKVNPDEPGGFAGYGMFLDALVKAAAHGVGGEATVREKSRLLAELAETQTPDGQISMFRDKPGFWDAHEGAYLIQAFVNDYRWFKCPSSLVTARRLADSLMARKAPKTLGSETAFLMLAETTGDEKYWSWLRTEGMISADIEAYDRSLTVNGVQHVYTWLARALAQIQYDPILCSAADEAFRRARGDCLSVTGSITGQPHWGELWDETQAGLGKWGETCASAYLMRLAAKRIESDPRTYFGDLYERVMYNAFFSAQSADGLKYRYWTPFNECPPWYDRDTYCCPNNYKREVFEIPDAVFYQGEDILIVNLYAPAKLTADGFAVEMQTDYPDAETVGLRVRMNHRRLRLRIPAWCESADVKVADGASVRAKSGWFDVNRDFSQTVDVRLTLPMPVRFVRGTRAQEGLVAVMRGPCVYALDPTANEVWTQGCDLWCLDPAKPPRWDAARRGVVVSARMPNRDRKTQELLLTRYSSGGRERTFFSCSDVGLTVGDELK